MKKKTDFGMHFRCFCGAQELLLIPKFSRAFYFRETLHKFRENKILANWRNHSVVYLYRYITPLSRISMSKICVLMLFAKIKFSRKFPNLQYALLSVCMIMFFKVDYWHKIRNIKQIWKSAMAR